MLRPEIPSLKKEGSGVIFGQRNVGRDDGQGFRISDPEMWNYFLLGSL